MISSTRTKKKYIGVTRRCPYLRFKEHKRASSLIGRRIRQLGKHTFRVRVLRKVATKEEMFKLERMLIAKLKTKYPHGYNMVQILFKPIQMNAYQLALKEYNRKNAPKGSHCVYKKNTPQHAEILKLMDKFKLKRKRS